MWAGLVGAGACLMLAACGSEPAVIPYDSSVGTVAPPPTTTIAGVASTSVAIEASESSAVVSVPEMSVRTGSEWTQATGNLAGLASECGNLSLVSAAPDGRIIAGVAQQGLWTSSDGGTSWMHLGEAGSEDITNRAARIVYDPDRPGTFWESGSYNGGGVYRTDDAGASFTRLGDLEHASQVAVDLSDPERSTLLVGRHETTDLYRSRDGGQTWDDISDRLPAGVGLTTSPVIVDGRTFVLGTRDGESPGIYRSTDGGETWTSVFAGGVAGAMVTNEAGAWLWLRQDGAGVVLSLDRGATWEVAGDGGPAYVARDLVALPNGILVTVGDGALLLSETDGATWNPIGPPLPYEPSGLTYSPETDSFFIWRFDCDFDPDADSAVKDDSIMRLEFALE